MLILLVITFLLLLSILHPSSHILKNYFIKAPHCLYNPNFLKLTHICSNFLLFTIFYYYTIDLFYFFTTQSINDAIYSKSSCFPSSIACSMRSDSTIMVQIISKAQLRFYIYKVLIQLKYYDHLQNNICISWCNDFIKSMNLNEEYSTNIIEKIKINHTLILISFLWLKIQKNSCLKWDYL